jgi:protein-S-isoprenylcysteine O-methyltransferase
MSLQEEATSASAFSDRLNNAVFAVRRRMENIHAKLSFEGWEDYPLFSSKQSLGRSALLGAVLGGIWGFHACGFVSLATLHFFSPAELGPRWILLWQWCAYASALSTFHLGEFLTTALYNPRVATSDSFLVNHSTGYVAAALTSWTEFGLRLALAPHWNLPLPLVAVGLVVVVVAQTIRSAAMITAGASFNHLIQTYKRKDHTLITHGIYSVLRHPSYVGFFYWSMGTQLLLGNLLHFVLFSVVSWTFFRRRIPFEEESLCNLFPDDYPAYVARSWMGIPFLRSTVVPITSTKKD